MKIDPAGQAVGAIAKTLDPSRRFERGLFGAIRRALAEHYNTRISHEDSRQAAFADKPKKRASSARPIGFNQPVSGKKLLYCDPALVEGIEAFTAHDADNLPKSRHERDRRECILLVRFNISIKRKTTHDDMADQRRKMHRRMVFRPDEVSSAG